MENVGSKQQSISNRAPRKNEVSQIKCQNKKLSKSKPEINPGSKLRVLAVTSILYLPKHNGDIALPYNGLKSYTAFL